MILFQSRGRPARIPRHGAPALGPDASRFRVWHLSLAGLHYYGTVSQPDNHTARLPRPRLCYLEIPAQDPHQSAAFYEQVFGWRIRGRDTERPCFDDATGYVSGAWVTGRNIAPTPGLLPYIWVDDIASTLSAVQTCGGEVVEPPHHDAPGGEWIATFLDPAGNVIGLYQEGTSPEDKTRR